MKYEEKAGMNTQQEKGSNRKNKQQEKSGNEETEWKKLKMET